MFVGVLSFLFPATPMSLESYGFASTTVTGFLQALLAAQGHVCQKIALVANELQNLLRATAIYGRKAPSEAHSSSG